MTAALPTRPGDLSLGPAQAAERRVQLALWASGESVWEWDAASNRVVVDQAAADENDGTIDRVLPGATAGMTLEQFFSRAHPDDLPSMRLAWQLHLRGAHPDIDVCFRILDDGDRTPGCACAAARWGAMRMAGCARSWAR